MVPHSEAVMTAAIKVMVSMVVEAVVKVVVTLQM